MGDAVAAVVRVRGLVVEASGVAAGSVPARSGGPGVAEAWIAAFHRNFCAS